MILSEVQEVTGEPGNFSVKLQQKPRFIDISNCTGCGECAQVCPAERKNEYDMGLNTRRAAFRRYAQAVPGTFSIEKRKEKRSEKIAVTSPKTVRKTIAAGKQSAISIDRYIKGVDLKASREKEWKATREVSTEGYDRIPRAQ